MACGLASCSIRALFTLSPDATVRIRIPLLLALSAWNGVSCRFTVSNPSDTRIIIFSSPGEGGNRAKGHERMDVVSIYIFNVTSIHV